ncbi:Superkiller protein 3, partial [Lunasporangiospora selenospora]
MGLVLSGLAYQNLGQPDKGEVAYKKAIAASPDQPLAREGLVNFYEKLQRWGSLMTALEDNLQFYLKAADEKKALSVTEQLIALYTKEGVMDKAIEKMQSLLPGSELYDLLSSDHRPDQMETLKRLAGVQETTDAQFYEREVRARRGRLGGGTLEQVQAAVRKEVYSKSQLGATYESIMEIDPENHKDLELKLLEFYVKKMESIAQDQKPAVRDKALALSSKMIQESSSPDLSPLPHELLLKFHDAHSSSDYDTALQHQYIATFPQTALSKMIQAQMHYVNGDGGEEPSSREELSGLLDEAFKMDSTIVYGYLVLCWMDYDSQDFEAGLEHSTAGRDLLNKQSVATAFEYPKMRRSFELCMANCQFKISPKLAPNALELYRHILQEDENNIDALQGVGFVLSSEERYEEATESFERVLALDSSHISARSEVGWICYLQKDYEQAEERLREVVETSENPRALDLYRLGRVYYDMGGEYKENSAYSHAQLIAAARLDPHCAGAFTYLGHYYREVVQDDARAEKCYQHAFTLDPRESAAGEHLSDYLLTSGSLEGAMDVYERVIEASKDHRSNNWALLRLGFAELIRGNNLEAMSAFQKLLRNDVKNPLAWEDSTVAVYHIARVHQRLGMYPEAIEHYEAALAQAEKNQEPRHVPSLMGITESFLEQGKEYFVTGCYGRSAEFLGHALEYGHQLLALDSQILSAWKLVGDACLAYRAVPRYLHLCPFKTLRAIMEILPEDTNQLLHFPAKMDEEPLRVLGQIQTMDASEFFEASTEKSCQALESIFTVAGMAYKQANVLNGNEGHPAAQFWYDIALSYYYRHENAIRRNGDGAVSKTSPWLGVTMRCLKASLQFEDDNPVVWNALGVASMTTNAKISQHALIKSIEYDPKNPAPWSNLGYLYILHSELDLALKAFTTAQTLDPSFGQAWTGQACVASLWGSPEATALFAHACESSTASILEANYGYAVNTFRDL